MVGTTPQRNLSDSLVLGFGVHNHNEKPLVAEVGGRQKKRFLLSYFVLCKICLRGRYLARWVELYVYQQLTVDTTPVSMPTQLIVVGE